MKKTIRKPTYWTDFEDLCKKLFGEIWQCTYSIKKNGRQGDEQFGVDVYAIPKDEIEYWGIQCKGKDEYAHKQLTESEIDREIKKAETFKPKLKTFIFATTANKNSSIEEYIRLKDIEHRNAGGFGILLYCWEDLVDLIEENRSVFNWYINGQQFKETHKVWVGFENDKGEFQFNMPVVKTTTNYKYVEPTLYQSLTIGDLNNKIKRYSFLDNIASQIVNPFALPDKINKSWCKLEIRIRNIGEKVIEDWKMYLNVDQDSYKLIDDDTPKNNFFPNVEILKYKTSWVNKEEGYFTYRPLNNSPLIQKDAKSFEIYILPKLDTDEIKFKWELLSRDYSDEGEIILKINHELTETLEDIEVDSVEKVAESKTELNYFYEMVEREEDDIIPKFGSSSKKK